MKKRYFALLVIILYGCINGTKESKTKDYYSYFNKGTNYKFKYAQDTSKVLFLDSSLYFYNKAIQIDSNIWVGYYEIIGTLLLMDSSETALIIMNDMIKRFQMENSYNIIFYKALILKKMHRGKLAEINENIAYSLLQQEVMIYPDSIKLLTDWMLYTTLIKGKERAIEVADSLKSIYNDDDIRFYYDVIKNFDRVRYEKTGKF